MSPTTRSPSLSVGLAELRVIVLGGLPLGVLLVGVGSRLAMLLLRVTSPHDVRGVTSDHGFVIGRFTLAGTYTLLLIGAVVGIIGAATYRLLSRWLIGPTWFRWSTTGAASSAVVGSMLLDAHGVDFTRLKPTWLAIGLFVALPALFGVAVAATVDHVRRSPPPTTRRARLLPIALLVLFPFSFVVIAIVSAVIIVFLVFDEVSLVRRVRSTRVYGLTLRSAWLAVAFAGLVAVVHDIELIA